MTIEKETGASSSGTEMMQGVLVKGIGSFYTVRTEQGTEYTVRCKKRFRRERMTPMTGDRVRFTPGRGEEHGWLEEILPRVTECLRPPVANVTLLVIVIAPVPEPDMILTDRQISRAISQGMNGAGKSTLLNSLLDLNLETGSISRKVSRGKNTTRHTELIEKDGLKVMDTAGFNLLEAENALEPEKLKERWPEFAAYEGKCRFRECLHDREPGCAVTEAAQQGEISEERLERYRQLLAEAREVWRERYD